MLLDKDENALTELNRSLAISCSTKKLKKIIYICSDLNSLNINNLIDENQITHYLNFAAVKMLDQKKIFCAKYMLETNSRVLHINTIKSKKLSQVFLYLQIKR